MKFLGVMLVIRVRVRVPYKIKQDLEELARMKGCSVASLVREAVRELLKETGGEQVGD